MTNEMQDYTSMSYTKFLKFIMAQLCSNPSDLRFQLDSFHTLMLNTETGEYKQLIAEKKEATFNELVNANPECTNAKQEDTSILDISGKKSFMENIFTWRKENDNINRYRPK